MPDPRSTTIPQVLDWLIATYESDSYLGENGVQVVEGTNLDPQQLWLQVGDVKSDQKWAALGNRGRDEDYIIQHFVRAVFPGDERSEARARIYDVVTRVEEIIRANPTPQVSTPQNLVIQFGTGDYTAPFPTADGGGFEAFAEFALRVTSRI